MMPQCNLECNAEIIYRDENNTGPTPFFLELRYLRVCVLVNKKIRYLVEIKMNIKTN